MTGLAVASLVSAAVGAGTSVYSAHEQNKQAKRAERAQAEALRKQEEEALKKGPEAQAINEEDESVSEARRRLLRRGFYGTLRTGMTGLGTEAATASTGLKGTLG